MVTEVYDGIPVEVPRQGAASYAGPAQRVIMRLATLLKKREGDKVVVHKVWITRVYHEHSSADVKVYYGYSIGRSS